MALSELAAVKSLQALRQHPNALQATYRAQQRYVRTLMGIIARCLVAASQVDPTLQRELAGFKPGLIISMNVLGMPAGQSPGFAVQVTADHQLTLLDQLTRKADLTVSFKHISLAWLVFTFQESTTQAFVNDRLIADGDVSLALRLMRCLDRLQSVILPKAIAQRVIKRYPADLKLSEKLPQALKIYRAAGMSWRR